MYELIQVGNDSFYMDCPTKVGFFRINEKEVVLIDGGSDKDAGRKIKKILDAQGWTLKAIYNTHSHADHIGGNQYLQNQTHCKIYAPGIDCAITEYPILEPTMLYGGFAMKELQNKFLMAKGTPAEKLTEATLPDGLELIHLPGHCFDMVGFRTRDNVVYLADSISSEETLAKYQIGCLYDVKSYLSTLEMLKGLEASVFVPAHAPQMENVAALVQLNIDKTKEIANTICGYLAEPMTFEDLLAKVFEGYQLNMNLSQYVLIGNTVKSYLSYLKEEGLVTYTFENNRMMWSAGGRG